MDRYDPNSSVDPEAWILLDESERQLLVEDYHRAARIRLPNRALHCTIHVVVENQIAAGSELPVADTLTRLMSEGLSRHDAIHAIGSVLATHLHELLGLEKAPKDPTGNYYRALRLLTAASRPRQHI